MAISPHWPRTGLLNLVIQVILAVCAYAGGVNWSNSSFSTNLSSTGAALDATYTFELGAFLPGFTPTCANTAAWKTNWRAAQFSAYNPVTASFSNSYEVTSNVSPFATSQLGYIWGHNASDTNGEWFLVSAPTWRWPAVGGIQQPEEWSVNNASTIILGGVNGAGFHIKMTAVLNSQPPIIYPTQWRNLRFTTAQLANPAISSWQADPDGDGVTNLLEYIQGRLPTVATAKVLPTFSQHLIGASRYLKLSVPRSSCANVSIVVSSDLNTWVGGPNDIEILINTSTLLEARDRTAIGSVPRRYICFKISD